jgi:hypothetical protein
MTLQDARVWQAFVLGSVLLFGVSSLDFPLDATVIVCTLATGILGEYGFAAIARTSRTPRPLSALISALSVLLLFRSTAFWTSPAVILLAVASKYLIRIRGQHWLNPTNFAVLTGTLLLPGWVSSGQWGHLATVPLALGGLGILVALRAGRLDSALTFLATGAFLELTRLHYYGYPHLFDVFAHRLSNGALWLFTFYMLTDPKTTPRQRWGRIAHACAVALVSLLLSEWYWKDTFLWALLFAAPLVPLFDWLHPRPQFAVYPVKEELVVKRLFARISFFSLGVLLFLPASGQAFCGFYVSRADATLYNSASQVVVVRDENRTVLTMVNNYRGAPKEFAVVVPVPVVLEREMVRVIDPKVVEHLDAYSAPRLVEYYDPDPCHVVLMEKSARMMAADAAAPAAKRLEEAKSLGVTIEAEYTVGEYDIVILSATESSGLETWLRQNNYNIPRDANRVLAPYIRSDMKFFVAKVNLQERARSGYTSLRPLQFAFESSRFMLPIRLGMLNADGPQDLLIYFLTKQYRVEVTNYRNPKLPSDQEIPAYIKGEFRQFYTDMFRTATAKENNQAVFTEYAWNMGWCDPCAADPISPRELESLGVWWLADQEQPTGGQRMIVPPGMSVPAFVTRLHVRYDAQHFPEDLMFKVTQDSSNFQGRYVIRHPWKGQISCPAGQEYLRQVTQRQEREAQTLASLTGWDIQRIRAQLPQPPSAENQGWKDRIKTIFKKQ